MIKYKATDYCGYQIQEIEIVKETEKQIVYLQTSSYSSASGERREAKESRYHKYFDTWQEAKDWLESEARDSLRRAKQKLDRARSRLAEVQAMKQPTQPIGE